ncbi:MAG TPA: tetratricopeptide repeat protein, partial [Ktedonobacteraceae bacterium]
PTGTVTLLFTDIEGSTRLLQQLGDRYADLLEEYRQLLRAVFQQWNGHEVDTQGDALFVAFARALDALSAAVDVQRTLAAHSWPEGTTVRVRMGLHTGEPSVTAEGYVGMDVHYAARLMNAGYGGQVLLSQTTRYLVEHDLPEGVSLRNLGEHRLKDVVYSSSIFQLVIAGFPADFPVLRTLSTRNSSPNNLPVLPTPLIGREQEIAAVQQLLRSQDVRLLTLTGPGGTGKTRLGMQVAVELSDQFPNGVFFVALAAVSDAELVVPTLAKVLGLQEDGSRPLLESLKEHLQQKQVLVLLDNFEQVMPAALQIEGLLLACPHIKVLVTSRALLHLQSEHVFPVPPLALPNITHLPKCKALEQYASVALFAQRARAIQPTFQVTQSNGRAIAEICVRLDGLPLAIELAAARVRLLPPQALLARLSNSLQVLTGGAQTLLVRQQTLRNTIQWSYDLLDAQEQGLFRRLSVFVGGWSLEAAEAVVHANQEVNSDDSSVLDGIASLLDKSLLLQIKQDGEEPRLIMLETIRDYAQECLVASGEMEATQQAHAAYYLALAEEAEAELGGPQLVAWLDRLEMEHDNMWAAIHWFLEQGKAEGDADGRDGGHTIEMALRLGAALERFWVVRGHRSEGRKFLEHGLIRTTGVPTPVRAKALIVAARLAFSQSDYERGETLAREGLALFREQGDIRGIALSLDRLGMAAWRRGNFAAARSLMEEDLSLFRKMDDTERVAWSLFTLGLLDSKQGEYARAQTLFEESLAMQRKLGNKRGIAAALNQLAGGVLVTQSDSALGRSLLEEALSLNREIGDKEGIAVSSSLSAEWALSQNDLATARSLAEESLVLYREMEYRKGTAESLCLLARIATVSGDYASASTLCTECLAIAKEMGDKEVLASGLEGLAGVIAAQESAGISTKGALWAAKLWGAAESVREAIGAPIPSLERATYECAVTAMRTQLGEETFAAAWSEGRSMALEQILATQG